MLKALLSFTALLFGLACAGTRCMQCYDGSCSSPSGQSVTVQNNVGNGVKIQGCFQFDTPEGYYGCCHREIYDKGQATLYVPSGGTRVELVGEEEGGRGWTTVRVIENPEPGSCWNMSYAFGVYRFNECQ